jgi:hypothetical protein
MFSFPWSDSLRSLEKLSLIDKSFKKSFYKQSLITQYYDYIESDSTKGKAIKVYIYNERTDNCYCLDCGENTGNNPRQLCGKSYCLNV